MDSDYICVRLKKLASLLYGEKDKPYAKEKKGIFVFGNDKNKNKVTKSIAMYLITGANIKIKSKK